MNYAFLTLMVCFIWCLSESHGQNCLPPAGCASPAWDYGYWLPDTSQDYFYLGGVFDVHERGLTAYECGSIRQQGVEALEAFLWTVRHFREFQGSILHDVGVGAIGFDSCSVAGRAAQYVMNMETCAVRYGDYPIEPGRVLGYVGGQNDDVMEQVATITSSIKKTLIGGGANGPHLSNSSTYFLRTVPSVLVEGDILVKSLRHMEWQYTQLVYTTDDVHASLRDRFSHQAESSDICIANEQRIDSMFPDDDTIISIINSLLDHEETRAVVLLVPLQTVQRLFALGRNLQIRGKFTWFLPSDVTADMDLLEDVAEGALGLKYEQSAPGWDIFQDYIASVTPNINEENPFFKEYWMSIFKCNLPGESSIYTETCDLASQRLDPAFLDPSIPYIIRATAALLSGIEAARQSQCSSSGLCSNFINHVNRWDNIHEHVRQLNRADVAVFNQVTGDSVATNYDLINFRAPHGSCTSHCYTKVGYYTALTDLLEFTSPLYFYDESGIRFTDGDSICQYPCTVCRQNVTTAASATSTVMPGVDAVSGLEDDGFSMTMQLRDEMWAMVLLILAGLGLLLVVGFEVYLLTQTCGSGTLAVSWRTMWLGQTLLLAIFLSYLTCFAFIATPSTVSCAVIRMAVGTSYAMIFSVLLVKLLIIFNSKSYGRLQGIYQVLMFFFALSIQLVIDIQWLIQSPPGVHHDTVRNTYVCDTSFINHIQSLVYIMFLIVITTVIAIKARGIFTNFREGVFIGLTTGFSAPLFVAWILVSIVMPDTGYEEAAMAYGLLVIATLVFAVMFLPKVRQLNSLGVEGIYKEDGRRSSVGATSVRSVGGHYVSRSRKGSLVGSYIITHDGRGSRRSSMRSKRSSDLINRGSLIVDGLSTYLVTSDPKHEIDSNTIQTARHGNISSLYLRHPGTAASHISSAKSMPVTSSNNQLQTNQLQQNIYSTVGPSQRILRVSGHLSGRNYSLGVKPANSRAPIPKF